LGLDNYPEPDPCKVLEEAGKLRIARDEHGDIDCGATGCPFMKIGPGKVFCCWIRGKIYNEYVYECCGESLYEDKTREELDYILKALKKYYKNLYPHYEIWITNHSINMNLNFLIRYLETLLSIEEWDGKLVAWF
jgi:hypothetical protein